MYRFESLCHRNAPYLIQSGFFRHLGQSLPNDKNFRTLLPNLKLMEPDNKEAVLDRRTQLCTHSILLLLVADVVGDVLNKKQDCSPEYSFFTLAD